MEKGKSIFGPIHVFDSINYPGFCRLFSGNTLTVHTIFTSDIKNQHYHDMLCPDISLFLFSFALGRFFCIHFLTPWCYSLTLPLLTFP